MHGRCFDHSQSGVPHGVTATLKYVLDWLVGCRQRFRSWDSSCHDEACLAQLRSCRALPHLVVNTTDLAAHNAFMVKESSMPGSTNYFLRPLTDPAFGRLYAVSSVVVVGRALECDLTFSMPDISRRHAALRPSTSGVLVEDLQSRNGVYINDRKIIHGTLLAGDELRLASHRFLMCVEAPSAAGFHPAT